MAGKRQRGDVWEYTFKKAGVLDKPLYLTFDSEEEGDQYAKRLEALLDRGIVPTEHQTTQLVRTIAELVQLYERDYAGISDKDRSSLNVVVNKEGKQPLQLVDAPWVDAWISRMKREEKNSPSTIRAKVGALARCCDWGMRKKILMMPDHPLRTLPDGYAQYSELDAAVAGEKKEDVERDRRLEHGEHEKILAVFEAGVLPRKQRPLVLEHKAALQFLYILAVESAMRLREMYTITLAQVDLPRRTVFLEKTKNGSKRQVPLSSVAVKVFEEYLKVRVIPADKPQDLVFPWWNGDVSRKALHRVTDMLSGQYISIFEAAGCVDLGIHDMRHEATSRLYERTTLSETEIMKITGHKSLRMMMRYANLRGSSLALKLW